jgi:hypothetical protein
MVSPCQPLYGAVSRPRFSGTGCLRFKIGCTFDPAARLVAARTTNPDLVRVQTKDERVNAENQSL